MPGIRGDYLVFKTNFQVRISRYMLPGSEYDPRDRDNPRTWSIAYIYITLVSPSLATK